MVLDPGKILVLAPHTDDGELGCGASIAKFAAAGKEIFYAAFCLCSQSLPAGLAPDTLEKECRQATSVIGIKPANLFFFNYEVRRLPEFRQQLLEELLKLKNEIKPDLVFIPASSDIHQDHQVIHQEGLRAFKNASIAGYELPWNNFKFQTSFFIKISEDNLRKKIEALKMYKSQSHRNYMQEDFIRSLAKVRGIQSDSPLAEAFEIHKLVT